MADWTKALFFFSLILMLFLEVMRMMLLRRFKLHLPRQAPWQETYYALYAFGCFAMVPFFTLVLYQVERLWASVAQHPYGVALFLLFRVGLIFCLLAIALLKIMPLSNSLVILVVAGTGLDLLFFLLCQETRILFSGMLLVLVTSAIGRPMRFTDWPSMLAWLKKENPGRDARVLLLVQEEAVLSRNPRHLFRLGLNFGGELDRQEVSARLREQFQRHGVPLTSKAVVEVEEDGRRWILLDGDTQYLVRWEKETRYFFIRRESQALNVYEPIGDRTLIRTSPAAGMPSAGERQGIRLTQQLTWRIVHFIRQRWEEWQALRQAGEPPAAIGLFLYLGIQQEFFPGWSALLDELGGIVAQLSEQIALGQDAPVDQESREMRIRGLLQKKLTPMLLNVTETNLASAQATYLNGTARWLRNRVTALVLRDWDQLTAWITGNDKAEARRKIGQWLAREFVPERKPGLQEIVLLVHKILSRLEEDTPDTPTLEQIETRTAEVISERMPCKWLDFVDMLSEQVAAHRELYRGDSWTEQLLDNARLEMIAQAVLQLGDRQDLLRQATRVVSANLGWFGALSQEVSQERDWNQEIIDQKTAEIKGLIGSAVPPIADEIKSKIAEAADAIEGAEEKIARMGPLTQGRIERLLSSQLLPRWEHDLQGLAQAIIRILPELAAAQAQSLLPEERLPLVRRLLEQELPASWQGLLDRIMSAVEENLPRLRELQQERLVGIDVLEPIQDLLKGYLDRWQPQQLFHWVYDVPEGDPAAVLYAPRVPPFEVKPRLEFDEYLGLFLTYFQQRPQGRERRRPA